MNDERCWALAAAALAGRRTLDDFSPHRWQEFLQWTIDNRLAGLLWRVAGSVAPLGERRDLLDAACRQVAYLTYHEQELQRVVGALAQAGVPPIFLKGVALAYTVYPEAALRPGVDHDVLVRASQAATARAVFEQLGYEPDLQIPGDHIASQFSVRRTDDRGIRYVFDIHLKISNALAYADCLSYDEIRADAVPMPRLDAQALAPSPVHSLFIACVHRTAHHAESDDLLWLYDIHLLAGSLTEAEWQSVLRTAETKQLSIVVFRGIERAGSVIGQLAPEHMVQRLRHIASGEPPAPLVGVGSGRRTIDVVLTDFRALAGTRARLQLLAEHLIPPASYMRQVYPRCPATLLPLAYAHRIVRGAPKWFRRDDRG